jgi:DNA-directed RNA polymerase subunit M/transcription elongation factor TFIIS
MKHLYAPTRPDGNVTYSGTQKKQTAHFSEKFVPIYQTTRHNIFSYTQKDAVYSSEIPTFECGQCGLRIVWLIQIYYFLTLRLHYDPMAKFYTCNGKAFKQNTFKRI